MLTPLSFSHFTYPHSTSSSSVTQTNSASQLTLYHLLTAVIFSHNFEHLTCKIIIGVLSGNLFFVSFFTLGLFHFHFSFSSSFSLSFHLSSHNFLGVLTQILSPRVIRWINWLLVTFSQLVFCSHNFELAPCKETIKVLTENLPRYSHLFLSLTSLILTQLPQVLSPRAIQRVKWFSVTFSQLLFCSHNFELSACKIIIKVLTRNHPRCSHLFLSLTSLIHTQLPLVLSPRAIQRVN